MIVGLNIPTTYRISSWLLGEIANFGFTHVRVDVPPILSDIPAFVNDYVNMPVIPLFLLHDVSLNASLLDAALGVLPEFWIQVWNEPPGMDKIDLPTYTQGILAVHHDCRARGFTGPILMGGLGSPEAGNRSWLSTALLSMPADVWVDEHRYAYLAQDDWSRPWPRYVDRSDENRTLQKLAGRRSIVRTEIGWHTAVEEIGFSIGPDGPDADRLPDITRPHTVQLTDEQATENYIKDFQRYESDGVKAVFVYQINDGPGESWGEKQGIRYYPTNKWKPQASAVLRWRALQHGS